MSVRPSYLQSVSTIKPYRETPKSRAQALPLCSLPRNVPDQFHQPPISKRCNLFYPEPNLWFEPQTVPLALLSERALLKPHRVVPRSRQNSPTKIRTADAKDRSLVRYLSICVTRSSTDRPCSLAISLSPIQIDASSRRLVRRPFTITLRGCPKRLRAERLHVSRSMSTFGSLKRRSHQTHIQKFKSLQLTYTQ